MDEKIWVQATIGLPGLPLGREVLVDPNDPYMADCLERGYLQPTQTDAEASEPEPTDPEAEGVATEDGAGADEVPG